MKPLGEALKRNWAVWLAIALPIAMIVFIAASIYLPRLWAPEPQYGFVYSVNNYNYDEAKVRVRNGRLEKVEAAHDEDDKGKLSNPRLYAYHPQSGESQEIDFDEAQKLKLDDRKKSPDGFEVKAGDGYSGPFGGSSEGGVYFSGHGVSHKLNLRGVDNAYNFQFIGWVLQ